MLVLEGEAPRSGPLDRIAREVLRERHDELGLASMPGELVPKREFGSLSGWHLRFVQALDGVPVHGSEVSAHVGPDGTPLCCNADVYPLEGVSTRPAIAADEARSSALAFLAESGEDGADVDPPVAKDPKLVIVPEGRGGRLAWRVDARRSAESVRVFVDAADGEPFRLDDLRHAAEGRALLFDPNPMHSERNPNLRDGGDRDTATLSGARKLVSIPRLDSVGRLRGRWADTTPTQNELTFTVLDFLQIARDDDGFEQLMCYHHVDALQERLQSLGVTNANAESQRCDAHALSQDQSYYDVYDDSLNFGDGGVDDAEDADVIRHEYGHAIQFDQVEDFGSSAEGSAMGEGFGDFLAAALHATGDSTWDPLVAAWDASSYSSASPPFLRRVDRSKVYPADLEHEPHEDGELWSRFLWDLRALVGTDDALRVAIESHFFLTAQARFTQGANAVILANRAIRGGADEKAIRDLLTARGLSPTIAAGDPPTDDAYEQNDDVDHPAPLQQGFHDGLVWADEDWYRIDIPANRRVVVTAQFDADTIDLALQIRSAGGAVVSSSPNLDGYEQVEASAGRDGASVRLRVFGPVAGNFGSYSLSVVDADLVTLRPGRTRLVDLESGVRAAFEVPVPAGKVARSARLHVSSRRPRGGAVNDVRLVSPSGDVAVEFGEGRGAAGAHARVPVDEAGSWVLEVQPRDGTRGRSRVRVLFQ